MRVAQTFRYRNMSECQSIVEYFSDHEGGKCGYCKQQNKSLSRGLFILHQDNFYIFILLPDF